MNQTDTIRKLLKLQKSNFNKKLQMADLEYGNRSISSLVQELNSLGNRSVLIQQTELIAIQNGQNKQIRRFQTKSVPKKQFFKFNQSDKKYFYSDVFPQIDKNSIDQFMKNWQKGYNCTILLQNCRQLFSQTIKAVQSWIEGCLGFFFVLNKQNELFDVFGQTNITHRELLENKKYYEMKDKSIVKTLTAFVKSFYENTEEIYSRNLINMTFKHPQSCAQLHLTFLPSQMFQTDCNPPFSLIKTQLTQLLNYIKMNPSKRYEHISKLITKRLPMTNYLTKILMSDSCNLLVNCIHSESEESGDSPAKFQFFDKLTIIGNLIRKADRHVIEIGAIKLFSNTTRHTNENINYPTPLTMARSRQQKTSKTKPVMEDIVSPIGRLNLKTQHSNDLQITQKEKALEQKQFDFCRSLQRKTHKFSISPRQQVLLQESKSKNFNKSIVTSQVQNFVDKKTISKYDNFSYQGQFNNIELSRKLGQQTVSKAQQFNVPNGAISQSQQITLLKAQHTREVSQYHQTIQLLNKKIMILTKELNLEELYKIHERQIMLLELKIKELREDIINLTKDEPNEKTIKLIVKKLTEEVKSYESTSTVKKLSQGRIFMLQNQIKETKQKLSASEKARTTLNLEVQTLTKRLKIRDSQILKIDQDDIEKYQSEELSTTQEQILEDIKKLVRAVKDQQRNSAQFLLRKISLILSDLSKSRDIILQCNDFLVQLMEILDEKLAKKMPQVVLDCNKFIRGFLMENLSIF